MITALVFFFFQRSQNIIFDIKYYIVFYGETKFCRVKLQIKNNAFIIPSILSNCTMYCLVKNYLDRHDYRYKQRKSSRINHIILSISTCFNCSPFAIHSPPSHRITLFFSFLIRNSFLKSLFILTTQSKFYFSTGPQVKDSFTKRQNRD